MMRLRDQTNVYDLMDMPHNTKKATFYVGIIVFVFDQYYSFLLHSLVEVKRDMNDNFDVKAGNNPDRMCV